MSPPPLLLVISPIFLLLTLHLMYLSSSAVLITTSISNETDRETLLAFREKLVNYSGPALSTWNRSTTHFCQWEGVTCGRRHPHRVSALNLSSQGLVGTISPSIANLTFLRSIDLDFNGLQGEIPSSIGRLHRLRHLSLANNSLQGEIPVILENCSNLQYMHLGGNQLQGRIPDRLGTLSKLEYLGLYKNRLGGVIPPSIGNISSLRHISLAGNKLRDNIPESLGLLASLNFFQVSFNNLSGTIPPSIYNLSHLVLLSVAGNELQGGLPPDAGTQLPNLKFIFLDENQLTGAIPASISNASMIETIELGTNKISGRIPPELGKLCLSKLNLGRNQLEARDAQDWGFLTSLTNCSRSRVLDLEENRLGGLLPISYWANFSTRLEMLFMSRNAIMGTIPSAIKNLVNLNTLHLGGNIFTGYIPKEIGMLRSLRDLSLWDNDLSGPIPYSVGNLSQLLIIDVHNNSLNGTIPSSLGHLQQLEMLQLSSNALGGSIPEEVVSLPYLSRILDLSNNFVVGPLPPEVGLLTNLQSISVHGNMLSGQIPDALGNCQTLEYLDLHSNFFQGSIPPSLSNLRGLQVLNLMQNNLTGVIPHELGFIHGLQELYLSHNNLSGLIPEILQNLTSLFELDLSFNQFKGQVPTKGVFTNISAFSVIGNSGLCGGILELHLPACSIDSVKSKRRLSRLTTIVIIPIASSVCCLVLFTVTFILFYCRSKSRKNDTTVLLSPLEDKYPKVSFTELLKATDGFASHNLIGMGRYGSVFKGMLPLKTTPNEEDPQNAIVAVKVFNLQQSGSSKTFIAECEALRMVRHRNLINIKTCCSSIDSKGDDFKALVFHFMPNQSLDRWLHSQLQENNLSLTQRLKIAVDVAVALEYLHNNCQPAIVHCDLKPSNILLDSDMSARVGDFGLAKLLSDATSKSFANSMSSIGIRGTIGYVAPEYGAGEQVSTLGDVYSFGIVLLEMFTGKKPTDDTFKDGLSLHKFVETSFPQRVMQIVDPMMLSLEENAAIGSEMRSNRWIKIKECLNDFIRVGLSCSKHSPRQRMSMKEAAVELRAIRNVYIGIGSHKGENLLPEPC